MQKINQTNWLTRKEDPYVRYLDREQNQTSAGSENFDLFRCYCMHGVVVTLRTIYLQESKCTNTVCPHLRLNMTLCANINQRSNRHFRSYVRNDCLWWRINNASITSETYQTLLQTEVSPPGQTGSAFWSRLLRARRSDNALQDKNTARVPPLCVTFETTWCIQFPYNEFNVFLVISVVKR